MFARIEAGAPRSIDPSAAFLHDQGRPVANRQAFDKHKAPGSMGRQHLRLLTGQQAS